ncbi:MAG TPA: HEAT repeat domain-containing protein [Gemmataceae bacterium]|nr:HEAT repeat domain-containing protein [Gemmataceae bacterium]
MNQHRSRNLIWLFTLALLASPALPARGDALSEDEQTLRSAGLSTDGPSLLAIVRKHTITAEIRKKIDGLIGRLGADSFAEREKATKELFALGRVTLPQLREGNKHEDPEIARRAKSLIERIEREPAHHLPIAAIRLLAVRKPAGVIETLLAYVPYAEDESRTEEVRQALTKLALRDNRPAPELLRALTDPHPLLRFTAAEALAKGGGVEGRAAVRLLLKDDKPVVRLRVALALALAKEKDSIPVLIDLLAVLPAEHLGEIESVLYQLAGDSAPKTPAGSEPAERKKCRAAWAAWWKSNAKSVDLGHLQERPWYGYTLICENFKNRIYEIDRDGKERWVIDNVRNPLDAVVVPGNHVLIAECSANRVTERDFKGKILWQKQVAMPVAVQRLPNGNTFVATLKGSLMEIDRAGKEIYVLNNVPDGVVDASRSRKGFPVYLTRKGVCVTIDTAGKRLQSFSTNHTPNCDGIDLRPNGHILITQFQHNKVVEYDAEGKKLLELDAPQVQTVMGLPNGHILVASHQGQRVYELDRTGKMVWEHKCTGNVYRARRR